MKFARDFKETLASQGMLQSSPVTDTIRVDLQVADRDFRI